MKEIEGSCLCSKISYKASVDFKAFYLCHCNHCQKDSGSAHGANLFATFEKLEWQSGEDLLKTFNFPGTRHTKSFCSNCGSPMPMVMPDGSMLQVPAGSIDGNVECKPTAHLFRSSKASWDSDLESLKWFDKLPE